MVKETPPPIPIVASHEEAPPPSGGCTGCHDAPPSRDTQKRKPKFHVDESLISTVVEVPQAAISSGVVALSAKS